MRLQSLAIGSIGALVTLSGILFPHQITGYPNVYNGALLPVSEHQQAIEPVTLLFTGDVMLGRHVERLMAANGEMYPFENIKDLLSDPHLTFVNLEGPIVKNHQPTPDFSTSFSFSEDKAELIAKLGIDGVWLGNNHSLDQGTIGYEQTKEILTNNNILFAGHATEMSRDHAIGIETAQGNITFLSFNTTFPQSDTPSAIETVREIRSALDDLIIVNMHWGNEYELTSSAAQQELAHNLIDAGADVIIGHHPHVTQEIEIYNDKPIFYSLGNFVFDQYFSKDVEEFYALKLTIQNGSIDFEIIPLASDRSQVRFMTDQEAEVYLRALKERSNAPSNFF
ncbi:MAG: CapA family protein [bacterium]|nr:CapA family protein [bacterium]MDA1024416.1 CapA family protein [bacterium]